VILPGGDRTLIDAFLELRTWVDFKTGIEDKYVFHVLVCGVLGKPPGRNPYHGGSDESDLEPLRGKLRRIRKLREEQLIDDIVALEYQRRLLDEIIDR
jgi:hypothetical protein